jgi:hypothetical protein
MPISKKAKIQREHKAAEKAGTRAPVKANGLPVKAPKPTSIVRCPACRVAHRALSFCITRSPC